MSTRLKKVAQQVLDEKNKELRNCSRPGCSATRIRSSRQC